MENQLNQKLTAQKLVVFLFYWFAMYILSSIILVVVSAIIYPEYDLATIADWPASVSNHVSFAANFYTYLLLLVTFLALLWNYYREEWAIFKHRLGANIGLGIGFYFVGIIAVSIVTQLVTVLGGEIETSENQAFIELAMRQYPYYIIPAVLLAPFIEETIFRGILFKYFENLKLKNHLNTILAFTVSSVVFGGIHIIGELFVDPLNAILVGLPYIVLGLNMCLVYFLTKSLYAVVITHFVQNLLSILATYLLFWMESMGIEVAQSVVTLIQLFNPFI